MTSLKFVITAGFAMFSMFFGSGNLVFPLILGFETGSGYAYSIYGWLLTAVLVPLIGLLGMMRFNGDRNKYFSLLGPHASFWISAFLLMLIGPFGVIARCITVSYGGLVLIFPELKLLKFCIIFSTVIATLIWKKNKVVEIIGKFLTPFKLGGITFLILVGLLYSPEPIPGGLPEAESISKGIKLGYQTMDLIGSFFFSSAIIDYLRSKIRQPEDKKHLVKMGIYSSIIGGSLLSVVYFGFIALGYYYRPLLQGVPGVSMLGVIAAHALGSKALWVVAFTLTISCLATATILQNLWVDFLRTEVCKNKISRNFSIILSSVITALVANMGFRKISIIFGALLDWVYPLLILYAIIALFRPIPKEVS